MTMLAVSRLHSGYGRIPILAGVTLSVSDGEIVGILGHNGMGKTTLLRTLMGYLPATGGSVHFDGAGHHAVVADRPCAQGHRLRAAGTGDFLDADRRGKPAHGLPAGCRTAGRPSMRYWLIFRASHGFWTGQGRIVGRRTAIARTGALSLRRTATDPAGRTDRGYTAVDHRRDD